MSSLITATFKTRKAAESALTELENLGVTDEQISIVITDETRGQSFNIEKDSKTDEGFAAGATAGGLIGAVFGALSTATAMAVPGLNIVIAGGVVSTLAGLGAGAFSGGLLGALVGAGIPEHEARVYEDAVKNGAILLAVKPESSEQGDKIEDMLKQEDAYNLAA